MGLLEGLLSPPPVRAAGPGPLNDFWYQNTGTSTAAGVAVSPESALKISTVKACVDVKASTVGQTPLIVYRNTAEGRERAIDHPLYDVLHRKPNDWQTAHDFKKTMQAQVELRGNAYAQIAPGRRGFADQLIPIHPDRVTPEILPSKSLRYRILDPERGTETVLLQDEVFHIRGLSTNGYTGISTIRAASEGIGLAAAAEQYSGRSYGSGVKLAGILSTPGELDADANKRVQQSFMDAYSGPSNAYKVAVLEQDLKWTSIAMTNEDAQLIESRTYQVEDIARFFKVPLVLIGAQEKTTSWGTGVEQIMLGFVTFTMIDVFVSWEQQAHNDLFLAPQTYFPEFLVAALLRGDSKTRAETLAILRSWGIVSADEWRQLENMNKLPNGLGEAYLEPLNMRRVNPDGTIVEGLAPAGQPAEASADPRARALAVSLGKTIANKELKALGAIARSAADDGGKWQADVEAFYEDLAGEVVERYDVPASQARAWAHARADETLQIGAAGLEERAALEPDAIVALLMGEGT